MVLYFFWLLTRTIESAVGMEEEPRRKSRTPVQSMGTAEECRRKRELVTLSIRKQKREEMRKRRFHAAAAPAVPLLQQQQETPKQVAASPAAALVSLFERATTPVELAVATEQLVC